MQHLERHDITIIFLSLGIMLALARALGELAQRIRQPAVAGELLAGLILGPSILGALAPSWQQSLFPTEGAPPIVIEGLTTLAIALFLLVAGMEVELSTIWRQGKSALMVGFFGVVVPFILGLAAALFAPTWLGEQAGANHWLFAFFFATALSISALPVIAKTLMDLDLYRSDLGMIIVAAAVFSDLVGWIIFAVLLGFLNRHTASAWEIAGTVVSTLGFAAAMLTVGRWAVHRTIPYLQAYTSWPGGVLGFAMSLALIGAALTEWIGIHAIFGSFIVGVVVGDSHHLREHTRTILLHFISFIFAPLFFASIGLKIDLVAHFDLALVLVVLVIACLGKISGCYFAGWLAGFDRRTSLALGFGLNARGAMEIILGLLALQNGLIGERMFVALVVMAIVTSMASGPVIFALLERKKLPRFTDYLLPAGFIARLQAMQATDAIDELCRAAATNVGLPAADVAAAVRAREDMMSTGLGEGLAVPHARLPNISRAVIAVGISASGVDFNAADGQPAHLIVLILTPEHLESLQVEILADLARTFRERPRLRQQALEVKSHTEFLAILRARE